jgi:hypothetical protein
MSESAEQQAATPVARLRAAILAEPALQAELGATESVDTFIPLAAAAAKARGIAVAAEALRLTLRDDPIGLNRWSGGPPTADRPAVGWLPIHVLADDGQVCVDWAWFGDKVLSEPFYEDSIRAAMRRPLNRLARHRTLLIDLEVCAAALPVQAPDGFIFHMSRCGSTLAAQMLAADPAHVVISEASPLDVVLRLPHMAQLPPDLHVRLIRAMVGILGHRRAVAQDKLFVKLDSWHTLAMTLFAQAFPDVPWVFMYREPVEVLASQVLERGMQTVPEYMPPRIYGLSEEDTMPSEDYCARLFAKTCESVIAPYGQGGGLLVNYSEMPGALTARILPHFGIEATAAQRAAMTEATRFNAKTPSMYFASEEKTKRDAMTDELRAVADRHIGAVYAALERLRTA